MPPIQDFATRIMDNVEHVIIGKRESAPRHTAHAILRRAGRTTTKIARPPSRQRSQEKVVQAQEQIAQAGCRVTDFALTLNERLKLLPPEMLMVIDDSVAYLSERELNLRLRETSAEAYHTTLASGDILHCEWDNPEEDLA